MLPFSYPFASLGDDLQEVIKTQSGTTCFLLNTACKELSREIIRDREKCLLDAYRQHQDATFLRTASFVRQEPE